MASFPTFLFTPFARKDAPSGDYLHRLIAVSIRRERRNFFASYKGAAASGVERKKAEERKGGRKKENKMEEEEFAVSYCRRHNGAGNPPTDATVFVPMQNGPIHNRKLQSDNAVKNFVNNIFA